MNSSKPEKRAQACEFCQVILQNLPYGIIICNHYGEIIFANQLAAFMLRRKQLMGEKLPEIMEDISGFSKIWHDLLAGSPKTPTLPFSVKRDDPGAESEPSSLSIQIDRLAKKTGLEELEIIALIEDLSPTETLDAADRQYTSSLESLVDEKNKELEFIQQRLIQSEKKSAMIETAGAVAHELRQPLTTVIGTIELLNSESAWNREPLLSKRLDTIHKQCLRMADTIKHMEQLVEYKTRPYINGRMILDLKESSGRE
ncbi:MAG: hypothetical protein JXR89_06015 [Deltaproteobacteria bacterium]|nr:hypothetical protein [Deltaproteobacteria bacterium]